MRDGFSAEVGTPSIVGVKVGGAGHFIAVLHVGSDGVTYADPMRGEEHLPLTEFRNRYLFTGFHLRVAKPDV